MTARELRPPSCLDCGGTGTHLVDKEPCERCAPDCPTPAAGEDAAVTFARWRDPEYRAEHFNTMAMRLQREIDTMRPVVEAAEQLSMSDTAAFDTVEDIELMRKLDDAVDAMREANR